MADPFSMVSSAAGIVSLGLSVVDAIHKYYSAYRDYDKDTKRIRTTLDQLGDMLRLVEPYLQNQSLSPAVRDQVTHCVESCKDSALRLDKKWAKIAASSPQPARPKVHDLASRYSRKLVYPFRESTLAKLFEICMNFQHQLHSAISVLGLDMSSTLEQGMRQLVVDSTTRKQRDVMDWLPALDFPAQKFDLSKRALAGTGAWLFQSPEFQAWMSHPSQTLFCPGPPGAGKTIMACNAIDYLQAAPGSQLTAICYVFCNYKMQDADLTEKLMASILRQLLPQASPFPESAVDLWHTYHGKQTKPSTDEYLDVIRDILATFHQTFLVIDALDECSNDNQCRDSILDKLRDLQSSVPLNILATSRSVPEISDRFAGDASIHISASSKDIASYIENEMRRLEGRIQSNAELCAEITKTIIEASDGIFLLAKLHMESLIDAATTPSKARKALQNLPRGSGALSTRYTEAVERIQAQGSGRRDLAEGALLLISLANRRLSIPELLHALAIDDEDEDDLEQKDLDRDNIPSLSLVLSSCGGLLVENDKSNIVEFAHYTAEEFFKEVRQGWLGKGHLTLLRKCLCCLSYDLPRIKSGPFKDAADSSEAYDMYSPGWLVWQHEVHESYALVSYATEYWAWHARHCEPDEWTSLVVAFLSNDLIRTRTLSLTLLPFSILGTAHLRFSTASRLHVAALYGLTELIDTLAPSVDDIDVMTSNGDTPLLWALYQGHAEFSKALLIRGADYTVRVRGSYLATPLIAAVFSNSADAVRLLLEHDGGRQFTLTNYVEVLETAAMTGRQEVAALMFSQLRQRPTRLSWPTTLAAMLKVAVSYGSSGGVSLLFEAGANVAGDESLATSLLESAAKVGHQNILVELFLRGAELPTQPMDAARILAAAAQGGLKLLALQLLDAGAGPDAEGDARATPLELAVWHCHEGVARVLLSRGALPDRPGWAHEWIKTHYVWTSWDAKEVHVAFDELVRRAGGGRWRDDAPPLLTPLLLATLNGIRSVISALLEARATPDARGGAGCTPLQLAAYLGRSDLVGLLLEWKADANAEAGVFGTAIQAAEVRAFKEAKGAEMAYDQIVRRLDEARVVTSRHAV